MDAATEISVAITGIHHTAYGRDLSTVETVVGEGCVACVLRFEITDDGRGGADPSEREPMGIYWYEFRPGPGPAAGVEWIRHIVDYGGRAGGGLQMVAQDMDGDGDVDVVTAGKTGLFLSESLLKPSKRPGGK